MKNVLITGASSGIGKALSYEFAKGNYNLALTARRIEELAKIRHDIKQKYPSINIEVSSLDVTDYSAVPIVINNFINCLNEIDIVIVNAGIGLGEKIGRGEFDKAKRTIETNLIGAIATIDAASAYFLEKGKGHIVGISSVAAFRGMPRSSAYCASKAGLAIYLEALRAEFYGKDIDVTVLFPGYIDTPLNNMLPNRPFLISVEKGASIIRRLIEKKIKSSTVPAFPWNIIGQLIKVLPTPIVSKISG
ncbi:MAG: SDR family oxidoreductase [Desulfobacterales bacterium]|nr:SDR family oxidoreductase [Desulfobacterales bacterium]